MPWRCPACHDPIRHNLFEEKPREGTVYRCPVCRLELILDGTTDRLVVAPLPSDVREEWTTADPKAGANRARPARAASRSAGVRGKGVRVPRRKKPSP
jgi:hypothetical protein